MGGGAALSFVASRVSVFCRPLVELRTFNRSKHLLRSLPRYYRAGWHRSLAQIDLAVWFSASPVWRPINHLGLGPLDSFRTCC